MSRYLDPEMGRERVEGASLLKDLPLFDETGVQHKRAGSLLPAPEIAHARKADRPTSKQAAASVKGISPLKQRILKMFRLAGWLTDEQLIDTYRKIYGEASLSSDQSIRSRRSDLVRDGLLKDSGAVKPSKRGNDSTVWRLK